MVEEGRLRAQRRAGSRVVEEGELRRAGLLDPEMSEAEAGIPPPLAVVLERLEAKAAELAAVRGQLTDTQKRHAAEVKALRREVHELREGARRDPTGAKPSMRPSLRALFGEEENGDDPPEAPPGR